MPMYADDTALCNDTVGRLQRSIDMLDIYVTNVKSQYVKDKYHRI